MPAVPGESLRPLNSTEVVDYGRRKCDPRAIEGIKRQLREMDLPDNTMNRALAAHFLIEKELAGVEAVIDRWSDMIEFMDTVQLNRGAIQVDMKIASEDFHRFNDVFYTSIKLANVILNRWHRFAQASMIKHSPMEDERR